MKKKLFVVLSFLLLGVAKIEASVQSAQVPLEVKKCENGAEFVIE